MANKFYAIKKGIKTGIFNTWDECQTYTKGFSGAQFKSFKTYNEALNYLHSDDNENPFDLTKQTDLMKQNSKSTTPTYENTMPINLEKNEGIAYVDGSYNSTTHMVGSACILIDNEHHTYEYSKCFVDTAGMRNVSGEIAAAELAAQKAIEAGLTKLTIYHDYLGIGEWANGTWKTNKDETRAYANTIANLRKRITINFEHVKGHSGNWGNERVDCLAKEAAGI